MFESEPIDGETPIDDISGLRIKGIRTRRDLNRVEAENIFKATTKYLASRPTKQLAPFDLAWCERLHGEMFCDVWDWAGQIRTRNLNIGVTFGAIRENLALLLSDLHSWSGYGMEIVEQAARLHFRAVHIHPFTNGNGRWSRMLANIWLSRNNHEIVNWPEATFGTESVAREEYIAAVRNAVEHEFGPLLELHRRYAKP